MAPGSRWAMAGGRRFAYRHLMNANGCRTLASPSALERQSAAFLVPAGSRACGSSYREGPLAPMTLWTRFVQWSYAKLGDRMYPKKVDICNCGIDLQIQVPQPELLNREGFDRDSTEWRMQLYGAALYWHCATISKEKIGKADPDMLRGKDVLEVACMRGGGARYLVEVAGPRSYVAVDNVQENIDICHQRHTPHENLRFEVADAMALTHHFQPESFDAILCVQAVASFDDVPRFVRDAKQLLRPGGRLIICEGLIRDKFKHILDTAQEEGLHLDVCADLSRAVHAVGLCKVPTGISYLHIVARKVLPPVEEKQTQSPSPQAE